MSMDICDDEPWHELCNAIVGRGITFADGATSTLVSIAITSSAILQSPFLDTTPTEIQVAIRDIVVAVLKSIMQLDIPLETHEGHLLQLEQTMAHLLSVVCNDETTEPTACVMKTISALHSQLMNDAAFLFLDIQVQAMNLRLGQLTDLLRDVQRIDDGKIDQLMNVFEETKTKLEWYRNHVRRHKLHTPDTESNEELSPARAKSTGDTDDLDDKWSLSSPCDVEYDTVNPSSWLGHGASAQVYFGTYHGQQVAVKEFKVESSLQDAQALLQREVRVWKEISGEPFVLTLVGYCINAERPLLVCEYCPDTIKQRARYFPERKLRLITELARGLASIHAKGIVHRDVKSYNVLVTSGNHVAIADFGLSRFVQEISSSVKFEGTLNFVSPEQRFQPHTVTLKSDMWSLGMTIYEILSDDLPFRGFSRQEIEEEIQLDDGERPEDPDDLPIELHPLWEKVQECWRVNPNDRPSALEFVEFLETRYQDVLESDGASSGIGDYPGTQDKPIDNSTADDMFDFGQTAMNWRPIIGVEDSKEVMALRGAIYTIYNQVCQTKIPINMDTPEFCLDNNEWLAHKTTIDAQSPVLQCIVRLPSSFHQVESQTHNRGFNRSRVITGTLKKFGEIKKRYTTRFFHLEGNLLTYYRKAPQLNGATLEENNMASLVMGVTNLIEVSAVHPHESALWTFELVTTTRTWILAAESEQDYLMWIEAICRLAPFYSIHAKYRRMFQLTNPDTAAAQEIRLVLLSSYTVEEALEHIFDHVSRMAITVARHYKDYALKITGARSYLFDLQQKLCSYQHVRSCVFPKRTMRLTLVHRSELRAPELSRALSLPQSSFEDQVNSPSPDITSQIAKSCDFDIPLRFSINRVVNIPSFVMITKESKKLFERRPLTHCHCIVKVELFNCGVLIDTPIETNPVRLKPAARQTLSALWDTSRGYETKLRLNSFPKSARIVLTLYGVKVNGWGIVSSSTRERILSTGMNIFDSYGFLSQGDQYIQMTADMSKYDCGAVPHAVDGNKPLIHIRFASHGAQVGFNWSSSLDITSSQEKKSDTLDAQLYEGKQNSLIRSDSRGVNFKNFVNKFKFSKSSSSISDQSLPRSSSINFRDYFVENPLGNYTPNEKKMMWTYRHEFVDDFNALPHVLSCANWSNPNQVNEILTMLPLWSPPSHPAAYIRLLDNEYANESLREFAVQKISTMADATFSCFLPQLVQALKHENHHVSPLAKLLMARAIKNPNQIGYDLFWAIKAEAHSPQYRERFGVLLNTYTEICSPKFRSILEVQDKLFSETGELVSIVRMVKHFYQTGKTKEEIHLAMRERLSKLNDILPPSLMLPLDSTIEVGKIAVQKCKIINFSHAPLWLEFDNAEEGSDPVVIIFRSDEDVRQECLVLQLIRLMDELWRDLGKDYAIEPYKCISTGPTTGIVQVVQHSVTRAAIQRRIGGMIAWKDDRSIMSWISANNGDPQSYMTAVDLFLRSCAGYCVATYVLGVGERNNANIMMAKEGRFFHVALRNFLGHPKNLFGTERKQSPFIFTPDMYNVLKPSKLLEHDEFPRFQRLCAEGFNIVRRHGHLLISLLLMMVPANLPSLRCRDDVNYVVEALVPKLTDTEAADYFAHLIDLSN